MEVLAATRPRHFPRHHRHQQRLEHHQCLEPRRLPHLLAERPLVQHRRPRHLIQVRLGDMGLRMTFRLSILPGKTRAIPRIRTDLARIIRLPKPHRASVEPAVSLKPCHHIAVAIKNARMRLLENADHVLVANLGN